VIDRTFNVVQRVRSRGPLEIYWRPPEGTRPGLRTIVLRNAVSLYDIPTCANHYFVTKKHTLLHHYCFQTI